MLHQPEGSRGQKGMGRNHDGKGFEETGAVLGGKCRTAFPIAGFPAISQQLDELPQHLLEPPAAYFAQSDANGRSSVL